MKLKETDWAEVPPAHLRCTGPALAMQPWRTIKHVLASWHPSKAVRMRSNTRCTTKVASALLALLLLALPAPGAEFTVTPFPPDGTAVLVVADGWAYIVKGSPPVPVASWKYTDVPTPDPPIPPPPGKVAGVWIIEEQKDRTAAQARIMDDPVWQAAAVVKKLSYRIEDKDLPALPEPLRQAAAGSVLPVVCLTNSEGAVIECKPLPATIEEMRALIGGAK